MEPASKLELHYFFNDDSHTIDANVRHRCEAEILAIIKEINLQFNLQITIETEAYIEGGLIDRWKLVNNKVGKASLMISLLTLILSRYPVSTANPELEKLNIEIAKKQLNKLKEEEQERYKAKEAALRESIREAVKMIIEEEKKDANKKEESKDGIIDLPPGKGIVTQYIQPYIFPYNLSLNIDAVEVEVDKLVYSLDTNVKLNRFKSNFYKSLSHYSKVTQISTTPLTENNIPLDQSSIVVREQFSNFIIDSDELPNEVIDSAIIEIIAPVLVKGKYKWKGIYLNESIEFYMKDTDFKESVYRQEVSFRTGIQIECILEIQRRIDDLGNINITSYSVLTVLAYTEANSRIETEKGKKIRVKKQIDRDQTNLDFPEG